MDQDPTFLSLIDEQYEADISTLLSLRNDKLPAGIDLVSLSVFREANGNAIFYCRYKDCSQAIGGFTTPIAREQHESAHMLRLHCDVPYCAWEGVGFRRLRDLKSHKQKHHSSLDHSEIPEISSPQSKWPGDLESGKLLPKADRDIVSTSKVGSLHQSPQALPPVTPGHTQLPQGQENQPALTDIALIYMDRVKTTFSNQPQVYYRFLEIMKDFKSHAIDTPEVTERISKLFNGHRALLQGFEVFLPPGWHIECGTDDNPDFIGITPASSQSNSSWRPATPTPPSPANPPPDWLVQVLVQLNRSYPHDRFQATMKHRGSIDPVTGQPIPTNDFPHKYLPRIMCLDCPGKLHTPGPGGSVKNFEMHLKDRLHRDKVDARLAEEITELELLYRTKYYNV